MSSTIANYISTANETFLSALKRCVPLLTWRTEAHWPSEGAYLHTLAHLKEFLSSPKDGFSFGTDKVPFTSVSVLANVCICSASSVRSVGDSRGMTQVNG